MKELRFVDVGEGITEGHVRKWLVKDGDTVKEDQPIVEVETDKAVINLPAPISGKISISAKDNTTVNVGDLIARIGTDAELSNAPKEQQDQRSAGPTRSMIPEPQPQQASQPQQSAAQPAVQTAKEEVHDIIATPSVRKLARGLGVDLMKVKGTGPSGKILEEDVKNAASGTSSQPVSTQQTTSKASAQTTSKGDVERVPLTQTRKAIARNMELSWTIPRAVHMDLIDAEALYNIVQKERPKVEKAFNVKLTFLPFIIKSVVRALMENPNFNASYDKEKQEILVKKYFNIGIAAEAPDGLKVIVIKSADKKSIVDIAKELRELGEKVRNQTITIDEMRDSTFTITNIGSLGGGYLSVPMINYPDVGILGVHLIREVPVVRDNMVKIGKELPISLVFDHRVVDGADAVKFGNLVKSYLEDPDFLEML